MKILILEDEISVREEIKQLLENALYQVEMITDFQNVKENILRISADLILMDVNLPEQSGFEICRQIRTVSDIPIIFVTSRTDSIDELNGMLGGGDDYITKPFNPPLLLAHIAAVLKRTGKKSTKKMKIIHKNVELDVACGCVKYHGNQMDLTKNELKILTYLFQHKDEIVPRLELVEYLWDSQVFIDDNTLSVNVTRLRHKLEKIGIYNMIETKHGMGYRV